MTLQKLSTVDRISEQVFKTLRDTILEGELNPGQELKQDVLAEELGVSRMPVREALRELAMTGLVHTPPHKVARVSAYSPKDIKEVYAIRGLLEVFATKLAAGNLTKCQLDKLGRLLEQMNLYEKKGHFKKLPKINEAFHKIIYETSNNMLLCEVIESLWKKFPKNTFWIIPGRAQRSIKEHSEILDALKKGQAEFAAQLISDHIRTSKENLISYLIAKEMQQT